MEEDLKGYLEWITEAEEMVVGPKNRNGYGGLGGLEGLGGGGRGGGPRLTVKIGKSKGDPVVMGLLKSTMFPLQQVLEGQQKTERGGERCCFGFCFLLLLFTTCIPSSK